MRPRQIAGFIAAIMIAFCGDSSAIAQGTDQQRQACTPDVFRLCGAYIPDVDRITACLRGNGPRLSRPCYDVLFPPQNEDPRRRFQRQPLPPGYGYDR
jgi:hypothetical protein